MTKKKKQKSWRETLPAALRKMADKFESGEFIPIEIGQDAEPQSWHNLHQGLVEKYYSGIVHIHLTYRDRIKEEECGRRIEEAARGMDRFLMQIGIDDADLTG